MRAVRDAGMSWDSELLRDSPPQDLSAERHVLGCVLYGGAGTVDRAVGLLAGPEVFYNEWHQAIFEAVVRLHGAGDAVDVVTVGDRLRAMGKFESVGGLTYLVGLGELVATDAHLEAHCKILMEKYHGRQVIHGAIRAIQRVRGGEVASEVVAGQIDALSVMAARSNGGPPKVWTVGEVLEGDLRPPDWLVEPLFARGDVVIVQADSGVGKTWLLLDLMLQAASGLEWMGRFKCAKSRWLYCDFDMHADGHIIKSRLKRLSRTLPQGVLPPDTCCVATRTHLPAGLNLTTGEGIYHLLSAIKAARADVCVLEVFSTIHGAANENDASQMDRAMSTLRRMATDAGCAIVCPHHTRKRQQGDQDGDIQSAGRGSSVIKARADCVIDLRVRARNQYDSEDESGFEDKRVVFSHVKARYVKHIQEFDFRISDDAILEGTKITPIGERKSKTIEQFREWFLSTYDYELVWQSEAVKRATREGICSEKMARMAIDRMVESGELDLEYRRLPGSQGRQKHICKKLPTQEALQL